MKTFYLLTSWQRPWYFFFKKSFIERELYGSYNETCTKAVWQNIRGRSYEILPLDIVL